MKAYVHFSDALFEPFPKSSVLAIDIETTGLNAVTDKIVCIAVSDGIDGIVFDLRHRDKKTIGKWLLDYIWNRELILHNAGFDLAFLKQQYLDEGMYLPYPSRIYDTMTAEQLIVAGMEDSKGMQIRSNLKDTAYRRMGLELSKEMQLSFMDTPEFSPLSEEQVEYAVYDVIPLFRIRQLQEQIIRIEGLERVLDIELKVIPAFTEMNRIGVTVDVELLKEILVETQESCDRLGDKLVVELTPHIEWERMRSFKVQENKLQDYLMLVEALEAQLADEWTDFNDRVDIDNRPLIWFDNNWNDMSPHKSDGQPKGMHRYIAHHMKLWRAENARPPKPKYDTSLINLSSPPQTLAAFKHAGFDVKDMKATTLKGLLAIVEPDLRERILRPFLEWRKHRKMLDSFGYGMIAMISPDGRLRGNFRPNGTATGRPTCSKPNLLQMPSVQTNKQFRSVFVAAPKKLMVVADYSQMELRLIAQMSQDREMMDAFVQEIDLHLRTAAGIFTKNDLSKVTDKQRKSGKIVNFGKSYGMGEHKLQAGLAADGIYYTLQECRRFLDKWAETFPQAEEWLDRMGKFALKYGYASTPFGRRRHFEIPDFMDFRTRGSIHRRGANHAIQGANADITKLAMIFIDDSLNGCGSIVLNVYDEIVVEVDEDVAEDALLLVREAMEVAAQEVLVDVPVKVDAVISTSWNEKDYIGEELEA